MILQYENGLLQFLGHYTSFSEIKILKKIEQTQTIDLRQMMVYMYVYLVGISLAIFVFILEKIPIIKYCK